jgi:hypothetical protein
VQDTFAGFLGEVMGLHSPVMRGPEPAAGRSAPAVARALIVWSVWVAATCTALWYVRQYARNIPFWEDFLIVPVMTGHEPVSFRWATAHYNEHLLVIPKLILAGLLRAIPDFRGGLYLNVAMMSAAAAWMLIVARRLRGSTRLVDAVLPLLILNIGQCECFLLGMCMNLVLTACISCALIGVASRVTCSESWWPCLQIGGLLVVLPLCGGNGLALLPPIMAWLTGYVAFGWWSGRVPGPLGRALGMGLLMITSAIVTWYLLGYQRPQHIPAAPSIRAASITMLESLSLTISPSAWGYWTAAGLAVVVVTLATILRLAFVAWRTPSERPRALGLCAMMVALLSVAAAVGFSRSGAGHGAGLAGRYVTILSPLLCAVYVAWLVYGPAAARRTVHIGLLALVCAGVPAQLRFARETGLERLANYDRIELGLRNRMKTERLLELACPTLHPQRTTVYECFKMLKKARVGKFRYMVDDGLAARDDGSRIVR